jgi:hypothetical protein
MHKAYYCTLTTNFTKNTWKHNICTRTVHRLEDVISHAHILLKLYLKVVPRSKTNRFSSIITSKQHTYLLLHYQTRFLQFWSTVITTFSLLKEGLRVHSHCKVFVLIK